MNWAGRRTSRLAALGLLAVLAAPDRARAQWGWGWWPGFQPSPATNYVNDRALVGAAAAAASRPTALRAPNPTTFRGRDPAFFERYDPETRRALEDRVARRPSRSPSGARPSEAPKTSAPAVARDKPPARPLIPLETFFNADEQLVWPAEAPAEGDLLAKRMATDEASRAALRERKAQGYATIGTVTDARNRLLAYGHPALALVASTSTPRVADSFQQFLNSLYESLGQAARR
jgi:hypothetical protein